MSPQASTESPRLDNNIGQSIPIKVLGINAYSEDVQPILDVPLSEFGCDAVSHSLDIIFLESSEALGVRDPIMTNSL